MPGDPQLNSLCRGLRNDGNTCFLNSTLQALAIVSPVHEYLAAIVRAGRWRREAHTASFVDSVGDRICDVTARMLALLQALAWSFDGETTPQSTLSAQIALGLFSDAFRDGNQHDAHELLTRLFGMLDDEAMQPIMREVVLASRRTTILDRMLHHPAAVAAASARGMHLRSLLLPSRHGFHHNHSIGQGRPPLSMLNLNGPHLLSQSESHTSSNNAAVASSVVVAAPLVHPFCGTILERVYCSACAAHHSVRGGIQSVPAAAASVATATVSTTRDGPSPQPMRSHKRPGVALKSGAAAAASASSTASDPRCGRGLVVVRPWQATTFIVLSVQPRWPARRPPVISALSSSLYAGALAHTAAPLGLFCGSRSASLGEPLHIEHCLEAEFQADPLPDDYVCDGEAVIPGVRHACVKQKVLGALPPALCIHVNRMTAGLAMGARKVHSRVRFDLELDLSPYAAMPTAAAAAPRGAVGMQHTVQPHRVSKPISQAVTSASPVTAAPTTSSPATSYPSLTEERASSSLSSSLSVALSQVVGISSTERVLSSISTREKRVTHESKETRQQRDGGASRVGAGIGLRGHTQTSGETAAASTAEIACNSRPSSSFSLPPHVSASSSTPQHSNSYELVAVIEHLGGGTGGHYVTHRRLAVPPTTDATEPARWVRISDAFVSPVSVDDVLGAEAYMLFYVRRSEFAHVRVLPPPPPPPQCITGNHGEGLPSTFECEGAPLATGGDGAGGAPTVAAAVLMASQHASTDPALLKMEEGWHVRSATFA